MGVLPVSKSLYILVLQDLQPLYQKLPPFLNGFPVPVLNRIIFDFFDFFLRKACPLRSGKGAVLEAGFRGPAREEIGLKLKNNQLYPKITIPFSRIHGRAESKTNYADKNIHLVQA